MNRLFETHPGRTKQTLDGLWQFKTDPQNIGTAEQWYKDFPSDATNAAVPSCWNNEPGFYDYEGIAWYSTTFRSAGGAVLLCFHGVTGQADVYLDGEHLGSHYGGFTGFEFPVQDLPPGLHRLTVSVDNNHNGQDTIPLAEVDWYHYGGITRSVEAVTLPKNRIETVRIDYSLSEDLSSADLQCRVKIHAKVNRSAEHLLKICVNGQPVSEVTLIRSAVSENVMEIAAGFHLENIRLWQPDDPALYEIRLETDGDCAVEQTGFRKIEAKNRKIYLNGKPVYLKGVNRHEDHPDWGFAMPLKLMMKDLAIIKNMGCNMIRGSHYPNAPAFLDLCDREGLLFMEEIPMWGFGEEALNNPLVIERGLMMHEEMVTRDYHHPCIFMWGLHNECATDTDAGYTATRLFAKKIRSMDSSRPVSYATNRAPQDICLSLADVISINKYIGWYMEDISGWPAYLETFKEKCRQEGLDDKPVIISEFGAGAVFGERTFEGPKWTENFQQRYLDYTLKVFMNDPDISGSVIWQYCDIRSSKEKELLRPRSFNNKGLLDEYRRPKAAYWCVKEHYSGDIH